jgi:hypothetical protein
MSDDDDTVGGEPLIEIVKQKVTLLAPFRVQPFNVIYVKYKTGAALSGGEQEFVLRCASDILDNPLT